MVLFSKDNYPITHSVLERLKVKSVNSEGSATIPNLVILFQNIFKKNKETFDFFVSFNISLFISEIASILGAPALSRGDFAFLSD